MKRTQVLVIAGAVAILGVVAIGLRVAEPPDRCAPGMVALGARCCGEGQQLRDSACAGTPTRCAADLVATSVGCIPRDPHIVSFAGGVLHIGPSDWEAEGVVAPREATVAPFALDAFEVTEAGWSECVDAKACMELPRSGEPGRAMSGMTFREASALCAFKRGRLPTGDELAFASASTRGRRYPWGDTGAVCRRAAWGLATGPCAQGYAGPEIAGSHPDGASPEGVFDLAGNVAEWAAPRADEDLGSRAEVRGGSWADSAASALRAWQRKVVEKSTRSREIGARCAYDFGATPK